MTLIRMPSGRRPEADPRPRRGRPRRRNEILQGGRLGGVDPEAIAGEFGTPYYAYDLDVISGQVRALEAVMGPPFQVAFAVKANPALGIVAHLAGHGLGADVASGGELATAIRAGVPAATIVMTGPGKRDSELRAAVEAGVRAITIESRAELARLEAIAAETGRVVPILLRAAVRQEAGLERVRLVGDDGAGKFGMRADELAEAARRAVRSPHVDPLGIHAFGASNVLDAATVADHVGWTMTLARDVAREAGFRLRLLDVGGGLGVPYEAHEESLDLTGLGRRLEALAAAWSGDPVTRDSAVLIEPGRFLVAAAGAYVARVVDRKPGERGEVVILDGGIHHLLRPALVGQEHRVRRLGSTTDGRDGGARFVPVTIAGPLCSGLDVLATEAMIGAPEPGDLVAVLDVGAYGFTESMPFFLSHAMPAEVAVSAGRVGLLRPRLEPEAWLASQRLPW